MYNKIIAVLLIGIWAIGCVKVKTEDLSNTKWVCETDAFLSTVLLFTSKSSCSIKTFIGDSVLVQEVSYKMTGNNIILYSSVEELGYGKVLENTLLLNIENINYTFTKMN